MEDMTEAHLSHMRPASLPACLRTWLRQYFSDVELALAGPCSVQYPPLALQAN